MPVHPTAIVSSRASIDPTAEVGPYAVIDGDVVIGPRTRIFPHAVVTGYTTIGADNEIHYHAVIGDTPQDLAFKDVRSFVIIGDHNIIREGVTVHRGTDPESKTTIANHCFLMANAHVGHNCHVADHVIMANGALLGGHVHVGSRSFISGNAAVHQFVRIGRLCMVAGTARAIMDVPHFMIAHGDGDLIGINRIGLHRAGFSSKEIMDVRQAFRFLWRSGKNFTQAVKELEGRSPSPYVREILDFVKAPSRRGIAGPPPDARLRSKSEVESE